MAQKECPKCQKSNGPRTKTCECGFDFFAVKSNAEPMAQPVPIKDMSSADLLVDQDRPASILGNTSAPFDSPTDLAAARRRTFPPVSIRSSVQRNPSQLLTTGNNIGSSNSQAIVAPSGPCPIKPQGYKSGWPDGPASDEVIQNWARSIYDYGQGRLAIDAVVYWSRSYWDINDYSEFERVKSQIHLALVPNRVEETNSEI